MASGSPSAEYQSLYRRYRSRRFSEVRGQDHVVLALRNAVREGRVGHAYLFSGPRGTGKTSTARILAKVLNCERPVDGEPCLECESCRSIEAGRSYDLHELDAASNNGVDAMRDLIGKAALGTPGRTKVYVLDEVHMLSTPASNALLKTLEEPPGHVVFVLATTDPHKVLPTIRSRTQHFEFHLLPAHELESLVRDVIADAGLDVPAEAVEHVLRVGAGSARDTLSALDQVAAAGGVVDRVDAVDDLVEALAERDVARAIVAVSDAVAVGRDPRVLGEALLARLRDVFLASVKAGLDHLSDADRARAQADTDRLERPFVTRSLEVLGEALVEMRQAPDPRICLEVALVRLTDATSDPSPAALLERIERLERALAAGGAGASAGPAAARAPADPPPSSRATGRPGDAGRQALGARPPAPARPPATRPPSPAPPPVAAPVPTATPAPEVPAGDLPTRDELTLAWGDGILGGLPNAARARYMGGRFVGIVDGRHEFALPNATHRDRCEEFRSAVEQALATRFGRPVPLRLVVDGGPTAPPAEASLLPDEETIDPSELVDAPTDPKRGIDRLTDAFPGAELIEGDDT